MGSENWGVEGAEHLYYYNTKTGQVEQGKQSAATDRVGPFKTRAEAERAPETLQARADEWAAEEAAEDE